MDAQGRPKLRIREVTVKSFSMAMGIQSPGFQLLSIPTLNPSTTAEAPFMRDKPCALPNQIRLYTGFYVPAILVALICLSLFRLTTPQFRPSGAVRSGVSGPGFGRISAERGHRLTLSEPLLSNRNSPDTSNAYPRPQFSTSPSQLNNRQDDLALPEPVMNSDAKSRRRSIPLLASWKWRLRSMLFRKWRMSMPYMTPRISKERKRLPVVQLLVDILEVAWPVITAYAVITIFIFL